MKRIRKALIFTAVCAAGAHAAPTPNLVFSFKRSLGEVPTSGLLEHGRAYFLAPSSGGHRGCRVYNSNRDQPCGTVLRLLPPDAQNTTWRAKLLYEFLPTTDGSYPNDRPVPYGHGNFVMTTFLGGPKGGGTLLELSPPVSPGAGWTETQIAAFDPKTAETYPLASPYVDSAGNIFLTLSGGEVGNNLGSVVEFSPPVSGQGAWTETIIHEFQFTDGSNPTSVIRSDAQGNLYVLTPSGGPYYSGAFIEFSPPAMSGLPWSEHVLYSFGVNNTDVGGPDSGLVADANGNLYGLSQYGGTYNAGTIYELSPPAQTGAPWTEQVIYNYTGGADGRFPYRGLAHDAAGNLFATSAFGGDATCQCGTLVELSPPQSGQTAWTETTLYQFPGNAGGGGPQALTVEDNGNFLVPTFYGGANKGGALIEFTNTGYRPK